MVSVDDASGQICIGSSTPQCAAVKTIQSAWVFLVIWNGGVNQPIRNFGLGQVVCK